MERAQLQSSGRVFHYASVAILLTAFFSLWVQSPIGSRWLDFPVYWDAGRKAVASRTVYDVAGHFQYKYSPLIALLFGKIFAAVSFEKASWIFQKAMLLLWAHLFWRYSGRRTGVVLGALLLLWNALRLDLELGQINALVLFLLALLFGSLERKETRAAALARKDGPAEIPIPSRLTEDVFFGAILALAVQLKLFCLILLPILLLKREWRKLAFGSAWIPILSLGGVALHSGWGFAVSENREWIRSLTVSTDSLVSSAQNVAILGTATKLLGFAAGRALWMACGLALLGWLLAKRSSPIARFREWALSCVVLLNPLVWSYWVLFLLPTIGAVLHRSGHSRVGRPQAGPRARATKELPFLILSAAAFESQHAKWAWNGGILAGILIVVGIRELEAARAGPRT